MFGHKTEGEMEMSKRGDEVKTVAKPRVKFGLLFKTDGSVQFINRRGNRMNPKVGKSIPMPKRGSSPVTASGFAGTGGAEWVWIPYPPPGMWRRIS